MIEEDLSELSMLDLFREEVETQALVLTSSLLALERDPTLAAELEVCMRAAHSLKGAARIVGLDVGVRVAHVMEDVFVAAQQGQLTLSHAHTDLLLGATDLLARIARTPEPEIGQWENARKPEVDARLASLAGILSGDVAAGTTVEGGPAAAPSQAAASDRDLPDVSRGRRSSDRVLRVSAENLNRLLSLAGESLVESRWIKPFAESLLRLKRVQHGLTETLESARAALSGHTPDDPIEAALVRAQRAVIENEQYLTQRLAELEMFDRRSINLAHRLYEEALASRMRPFADGVEGLPRMVRDLARSLGRQVKLDIVGGTTRVDRDILAKLDAPLGHLLRNALDHGLEAPDVREAAGKPPEGLVRVEARHSAGALHIIVSDDGCGVDLEKLREAVVTRNLTTREASRALSDAELLEFLFLPGFSMKGTITEVSGRGVGLDVVQDMVRQVRGTVRVSSQRGKGTRFQLQLPVTLSVVRTLLVDIAGEPYAFPLAYILRTLKLSKDKIELLEGRQHFEFDGRHIGLVTARQVFAANAPAAAGDELPVIVVGDEAYAYGLVVDHFLGERELVVQPLDAQLGKIKDIAAGALMEDGSPVLIVDVDDMIRSMDKLASAGGLATVAQGSATAGERKRKRVLVVDDSLTVRELERKLLGNRGYEVEVAVDGMDGWNAVRTGHFDLVVTDIDMPRMDGIELVSLITGDPILKAVPVMIVSYKDRDEDRQRGLEAGAAYYLTKGSFHDETLLQAVVDLIGEPVA
jgi:two-component system, chemotaxis family, sensor histidine kinase and response regulator WspE